MKPDTDFYTKQRNRMVRDQIESRGVRDLRVLNALRMVPRHLFVPEGSRNEAYDDYPLPIGQGQTISQPYIVAYMTEQLELKGNEKVLEIGAGSGYQTAVLAELVKYVYTIEFIDTLAQAAADRLKELHYDNVRVKSGDGYAGWAVHAPFDAIIVTAAAPYVPESLIAQLKDGGRLIIPLGDGFDSQVLTLIRKKGDRLTRTILEPVRFVPMRGEIERVGWGD
jgi:protein-L-isoaspartate(D-aspartate) O-methyltransferase